MYTKFGPDRSSFPTVFNCWPIKPTQCTLRSRRVIESFPVDGAAALGFRQVFFEVHRAWNNAASDLLLCQRGVMFHCMLANLVVSRLPIPRLHCSRLIRSETGFAPMRAFRIQSRIRINELSRFKVQNWQCKQFQARLYPWQRPQKR